LVMWERMTAPVAGEGVVPGRATNEPPMPHLTSGTTAMEAVRVTRVVSGDCGLRMMVPSTMAGEVESSWGEVGMVTKASSVHSSLEDS